MCLVIKCLKTQTDHCIRRQREGRHEQKQRSNSATVYIQGKKITSKQKQSPKDKGSTVAGGVKSQAEGPQ